MDFNYDILSWILKKNLCVLNGSKKLYMSMGIYEGQGYRVWGLELWWKGFLTDEIVNSYRWIKVDITSLSINYFGFFLFLVKAFRCFLKNQEIYLNQNTSKIYV